MYRIKQDEEYIVDRSQKFWTTTTTFEARTWHIT